MALYCPRCGSAIAPERIRSTAGTATCDRCHRVFDYRAAGVEVAAPTGAASAAAGDAAIVPRPPRMHVERAAGVCRISWRWYSWMVLPMAGFAAVWDAFLIFWYSIALSGHVSWIEIVFPAMHVAVGVAITYGVLTGLLNSTVIEAGRGELVVRHGPLPWRGNRRISTAQIEQLYCERNASRTPSPRRPSPNQYRLCAVLRGGQSMVLVSSVDSLSEGQFLEHLLEQHLSIKPRPVVGEATA